jgi:SAM-dependent methyltransferase
MVSERLLLALDTLGRHVFSFDSAPDITDPEIRDERFARAAAVAEHFEQGFWIPLKVTGAAVLEVGAGYGALQAELLRRGATRAIALDPSEDAVAELSRRLGSDRRLEVVQAPLESCPLPDESVDVVVSYATFEHLGDLDASFAQLRRVLKPGGLVFVKYGQPWLHYNGPHLVTYIHVPWAHLFFRDRTIRTVLERYRREGRYPAASIDARLEDLDHMNRLSLTGHIKAIKRSGLEILQLENMSPRAWKRWLSRVPLAREFLPGELTVILKKPG